MYGSLPEFRANRIITSWTKFYEVRVCEVDVLTRLGKRSCEVLAYLVDRGSAATVGELMDYFAGERTQPRHFRARALGKLDCSDGGPRIVRVNGRGRSAVVSLCSDWRKALEDALALAEEPEAAKA